MLFSLDRVEESVAVLVGEDKRTAAVPADFLPDGVREGDMLCYDRGKLAPAPGETAARRSEAERLLAKLLGR